MSVDESERDVSAVFVPCALDAPIAAASVHQAKDNAIGCFIGHCKQHFAQQGLSPSQLEAFKAQTAQQIAAQAQTKGDTAAPDQNLIGRMAGTTMVDVIVLHPNMADTKWVSINMYVDDKGMAKQLPLNQRATSICQACGKNVRVLGDVFIGKQFDDNEGFKRLDFTLADLESSAEWMKEATAHNLKERSPEQMQKLQDLMKSSQIADQKKAQDKSNDERLKTRKVVQLKEKGNRLFNDKKFAEAVATYAQALELLGVEASDSPALTDGSLDKSTVAHALLSNRSACHHLLGDFDKALADAVACSQVKPEWPKGFARQATALASLGRKDHAVAAINKAIALTPTDSPHADAFKQQLAAITKP